MTNAEFEEWAKGPFELLGGPGDGRMVPGPVYGCVYQMDYFGIDNVIRRATYRWDVKDGKPVLVYAPNFKIKGV